MHTSVTKHSRAHQVTFSLTVYAGLMKKLWEAAFKENHLKGGFRACGLHPMNRDVIPVTKLATSVPHTEVVSSVVE